MVDGGGFQIIGKSKITLDVCELPYDSNVYIFRTYSGAKSQCGSASGGGVITLPYLDNPYDYAVAKNLAASKSEVWIGVEPVANQGCQNGACMGRPNWLDGNVIYNFNSYMNGGIDIQNSDRCARFRDGKINGLGDCSGQKEFMCMSVCTSRPACSDPSSLANAQLLWNGRTVTAGGIVR